MPWTKSTSLWNEKKIQKYDRVWSVSLEHFIKHHLLYFWKGFWEGFLCCVSKPKQEEFICVDSAGFFRHTSIEFVPLVFPITSPCRIIYLFCILICTRQKENTENGIFTRKFYYIGNYLRLRGFNSWDHIWSKVD